MRISILRREIDRIDRQLIRLLSRRARFSLAIGRLKRKAGLPLFHHQRELEIARNVRRANRGPLSDRAVEYFFQELLRLTRIAVRASLRSEHGSGRKARPRRRA